MRPLVWALFAVVVIAIAFFVIPRVILLVTTWNDDDETIDRELQEMIEDEKGGPNG